MKKEYNLLESYEWFGTFWFADNIEDKFSGRLYYKPTGELYLEAITKEEDFYNFSKDENIRSAYHIFGLVDGVNGIQDITLFKCLVNPTNLNYGIASKLKINIARLVIGRHFPSDFKFANCIVKYKYLDEFILETNNPSGDIIKQFNINDKFNVEILPRFFTFYKADLALNWKENETDEEKEKRKQKLKELKVYINNELSEINSSVKNTSKADIYNCKFYRKDGKPDSIAELFKVASIIQQAFSLLMCKYLYAEEQFVTYVVKNQSDNSSYNNKAFVFQNINIFNLSEKELNNLPESNNYNGIFYNPFNIDMLSDSEVKKFIKIINDKENNMLIDYLFSFINPKFSSFNKKEKFILVMSLLEREANILDPKVKETDKYDIVIEKYADKEILDIFLGILKNQDIYTVKVELEDILKQSKTYCLGSVLAFLRSNIVHNEEELKIPNFDRQIKKGMKNEYNNLKIRYQDYWLESHFVLPYITKTISVLLFKILYSKVIQNKEIFNKAIEKLLTQYFGSNSEDKDRKEVINKNIKLSIKLTKDLNDIDN